jgi:DNA-binding transcriptional ArsR family regulator
MPAPDSTFALTPTQAVATVALEPVHNILNSMVLLNKAGDMSGYGQWVTQTAASLPPELAHDHLLVLEGLHYAVIPTRSWPSFQAYITHLAEVDPVSLRDALLNAYNNMTCKGEEIPLTHPTDMLATLGTFLDYLQTRFSPDHINLQIESEAYSLLKDPPAMRDIIVTHLQTMWDNYLAAEWARITPMLQSSVTAFQQIDFIGQTPLEATRQIIGQEVPEGWKKMLEGVELEQLIFVPSAHIGPYLRVFKADGLAWLFFGARLPQGVQITSPDLSRSELLVRLSALADDTRLRILHLLGQQGERCSKDIMIELDLSQSAVSRHLQQLSATGYLSERRVEGAKCYSLGLERIQDTFQALEYFLSS